MVHPTSRSVPVNPRDAVAAWPSLSLLHLPLTSLLGILLFGTAIPAIAHSEEAQQAPAQQVTREARMLGKGVELLDKTDSEERARGLQATRLQQIERVTPTDQGVVSWKEDEADREEKRSPQAYDAAAKSLPFGQGSINALRTPVANLTKPVLPAPNRRTQLVAQGRGGSILDHADKQSASAFATGTNLQRFQRREWRAEPLHP